MHSFNDCFGAEVANRLWQYILSVQDGKKDLIAALLSPSASGGLSMQRLRVRLLLYASKVKLKDSRNFETCYEYLLSATIQSRLIRVYCRVHISRKHWTPFNALYLIVRFRVMEIVE